MTRRKIEVEPIGDIQPDRIYRTTLSSAIFGYGPQATRDKIRNGELPMPFPLSPTSRFEAWTGRQSSSIAPRCRRSPQKRLKQSSTSSDRDRGR
jgi:hypothetical protein